MNIPDQKLPRVEPGHEPSAFLKLPRQEGQGVQDAPGDQLYPKTINHPVHGYINAVSAEHEAALMEGIANLPPSPSPSETELEILHLEALLKRPLTEDQKAFIYELEAAVAEDVNPFFASTPPDPEEEPDEVIVPPAVPAPPAVDPATTAEAVEPPVMTSEV